VRYLSFALFCLTIPAANWMIQHVGVQLDAHGPHLIPVGFGLMAPSGVLMIGASLVLRDVVQLTMGRLWGVTAIVIGGLISGFIAPPALALASALAFLTSETADMAVYTPLAQRRLFTAVLASCAVGAIVDSALFLFIAFHSLQYLEGQIVGKLWAALFAAPLIVMLRRQVVRA